MRSLLLVLMSCSPPEGDACPAGGPHVYTGSPSSEVLAGFCAAGCPVAIEGDLVAPLDGAADLACVTSVSGDVVLYGAGVSDPGVLLPGLTEVGGSVRVGGARTVLGLRGFSSLARVGGDLSISDMPALQLLDTFGALRAVDGALWVGGAPVLTAAAPFGLETVGGTTRVSNVALTDLSLLDGLTTSGLLYVDDMPLLTTLSGVETLRELRPTGEDSSDGAEVRVAYAPRLTSIDGLSGLDWPSTRLFVHATPALEDLPALSGQTALGGLSLTDTALTDLSALSSLETVEGDVDLSAAGSFRDLDALAALREVRGSLVLSSLPDLVDIDALIAGLESIQDDLVVWESGVDCEDVEALAAGTGAPLRTDACEDDDWDDDPDPDDTGDPVDGPADTGLGADPG